ncbi:MAG TPA: MBL fold metallo-hydrolase, partial [Bacteroidetes bacterium]|nr:MBL fold metallo-hydrolase [Bacteroidota bacterium]
MVWFITSKKFCDDKCYFIPGMANSTVFETNKGLVIFDLPTKQNAMKTFQAIRKFTTKPVKYLIYSHGHFDHAYGSEPFIKEIKEKKWEIPEIIAHENCIRRFKKYKLLDKYHEWINRQQFASVIRDTTNQTIDPNKALYPTIILRGNESNYFFTLDGLEFELYHDKGETDDSIWLWVPEKEIICSGDLILSSFPNIGNPYKVQRYPKDWAIALDKMLEKGAKYLAPGHGQLIEGKENVEDALSITAEALHFVHDEIVNRLNEG